jgi:poly-gamma-glutamate capsule biosynthesis protein CapA/YwtB (metallophosphatase superfamily)
MVTIALGGDTMLGRMVGRALAERPAREVWDPQLLEVFAEADLAVVNLECCISERGEPWPAPGKPFFFRAPPVAIEVLTAAGVKAVWLGNNHALDFGEIALLDTFDHLESAGIAWAGAGRTAAEARRGAIVEAGGTRVGVVGFADHPADFAATASSPGTAFVATEDLRRSGPPAWLTAEIRRLAGVCEVVVVGPHWGPNMALRPMPHHPAVARALAAAGASLVSGHSAHVVQPIDVMDGVPICYDLGDLLDDYAVDPVVRNDLGALALFTPGVSLELVPLRLEYARTRLADGADHAELTGRLLAAAERNRLGLRLDGKRLVLDLGRGPDAPR